MLQAVKKTSRALWSIIRPWARLFVTAWLLVQRHRQFQVRILDHPISLMDVGILAYRGPLVAQHAKDARMEAGARAMAQHHGMP